ncbi:MAG: hypothetical protein IKI95_00885 [Clostridia bacterium]|nr:hypothetical protein [Clostridia bacterium]
MKYTIESISNEGQYFLVNGWNKHKTFWVKKENLKQTMLFKTPGQAKVSLTKLLKIMEDYKKDKFKIVEIKGA